MKLTQDRLIEALSYDPETGVFKWKIDRRGGIKAGDIAGNVYDGYIRIKIYETLYRGHRLAWLYVYGSWPEHEIDHINGDRADNRIANLRDITKSCNLQNQFKAHSNSKSGILGVAWHPAKNKWGASIRIDGRQNHIGYFDSACEAGNAYLERKRALHPYGEIAKVGA